jgi:hypothetical protein
MRRQPSAQIPREFSNFLRVPGFADTICIGREAPAEMNINIWKKEDRPLPHESLIRIETTPRRLNIFAPSGDAVPAWKSALGGVFFEPLQGQSSRNATATVLSAPIALISSSLAFRNFPFLS